MSNNHGKVRKEKKKKQKKDHSKLCNDDKIYTKMELPNTDCPITPDKGICCINNFTNEIKTVCFSGFGNYCKSLRCELINEETFFS